MSRLLSSSIVLAVLVVASGCDESLSSPRTRAKATAVAPAKDSPRVVRTEPASGAVVAASTATVSVIFDRPMRTASWSWVEDSPGTRPVVLGEPTFSADRRTCTLPVQLQPGRPYVLWVNGGQQRGFRDEKDRPAQPYRLAFFTAGEAAGAPRVIATDPPDSATDVDPARVEISVTFDQAMNREGWSWVKSGDAPFPEGTGQPSFDASGRTNTLPVRLQPATRYVLLVNSRDNRDFQSAQGVPSVPFLWTFTTRAK